MDELQQDTKKSKRSLFKGHFMSPTAASRHRFTKDNLHNKPDKSEKALTGQPRKLAQRISEERYERLMHGKRESSKVRNQYGTVQYAADGGEPNDGPLRTGFLSSRGNRDSLQSQEQVLTPKGANYIQKKPTRIVKGGPSNMEKRINTRQSRSRDRSFKERYLDQSAHQGPDASSFLSASNNFVSMKSTTEKAYQQRKLGIYGLKPYQSEKSIVALEEPKPNQVNLALQQMHIKKDLARLRGNIATSEPVAGKDTSEEEDSVPPQEMGNSQSELYLITKIQMKQLLFEINYLPFLKNQQKYNVDSKILLEGQRTGQGSNFKEEIQYAITFVDQLWLFLNIENAERIRRYDFYKVMKILMLNIGKLSDSEMHFRLARYFIWRWEKYGVMLRPPRVAEEEQPRTQPPTINNMELSQDAMTMIQEEPEIKARMIFSQYQNPSTNNRSEFQERYQENLGDLNDVQLINRHNTTENPSMFTIQRFYKAFKHDHAQRFAYIQHEEATMKTTKIMLSPRLQLDKQTHETLNMIPVDGRKYKEHTIKDVIDQHTFKPKITNKYDKAIELRYARIKEQMQDDFRSVDKVRIFEQGPESNRIRQAFNLEYVDDDNYAKGANDGQINIAIEARQRNKSNPNYNLEGSENQRFSFPDQRKLDFHQKYEIRMYEHKLKEQDRMRKKNDKEREQIENQECTFSPKINKKFLNGAVSPTSNRNFWDRTLAPKDSEDNNMEPQTNQLTQFAWSEHERKRQIEDAELTFRPKINKNRPPFIRSMSEMGKHDFKSNQEEIQMEGENFDQLRRSVNGFEKAVKRMKDHQADQKSKQKKIEELSRGVNYAKLRALESKPPSFIVSPRPKKVSRQPFSEFPQTNIKRGNIIFNAHISITPTRTESLIMRDGEDPKMVAELFAQRFNLGESAKQTLIQQLEYNIKLKQERKNMQKSNAETEKPKYKRTSEMQKSYEDNKRASVGGGNQPKSKDKLRFGHNSPQTDLKKSIKSSGVWSPTTSNSPEQPKGQKGSNYTIKQYTNTTSRGKGSDETTYVKSVSNFQSVPGVKSMKTMLRKTTNETSIQKQTGVSRDRSQLSRDLYQVSRERSQLSRERSQAKRDQIPRSNIKLISASTKNLRNTGVIEKTDSGEQFINHRNKKTKLPNESKGSTLIDSSPTLLDAESQRRMDERARKRQKPLQPQAMISRPGKHVTSLSQQMDQTSISKNAAGSNNNNTSQVETYKEGQDNSMMNNPIRNTDLISLIESEVDNKSPRDQVANIVLQTREESPKKSSHSKERQRQRLRLRQQVVSEEEDGMDDEEQPPEETEGNERIDNEILNRSVMKNGEMEVGRHSINSSTMKWTNQHSLIDPDKYQTIEPQQKQQRFFEEATKKTAAYQSTNVKDQRARQTTNVKEQRAYQSTTTKEMRAYQSSTSTKDLRAYQSTNVKDQRANFSTNIKDQRAYQSANVTDKKHGDVKVKVVTEQRQLSKGQTSSSGQRVIVHQTSTKELQPVVTKQIVYQTSSKGISSKEIQPESHTREFMSLINTSDNEIDFHLSASKTLSRAPMETQQSMPSAGGGEVVVVRRVQKVQGQPVVTKQIKQVQTTKQVQVVTGQQQVQVITTGQSTKKGGTTTQITKRQVINKQYSNS